MNAPDVPLREGVPHPVSKSRFGLVSWRHWFREVAVIAAGALAALAAQAWWQNREDAGRERDCLRQLVADTRENARRLDRAIAGDSAAGWAAGRVAEVLYSRGPTPPNDSLLAWFVDDGALSTAAFDPLIGTYAMLVATGDLRLIHDNVLRRELVTYEARLNSVDEGQRLYSQQAFTAATRLVRAFPFLRGMFSGEEAQMRAEAHRFSFAPLRGDADVIEAMFSIQAANSNRVHHLRDLRDDTRDFRRLLEAHGVDANSIGSTSGGDAAR